jgi:hypothetical protein
MSKQVNAWGWGKTRFATGRDQKKYLVRSRKYGLQRACKAAGITVAQYEDALGMQGGVCAICQGPPVGKNRLSIDHDHQTGVFRGLLCDPCNRMLGYAKDSVETLENGVKYLWMRTPIVTFSTTEIPS